MDSRIAQLLDQEINRRQEELAALRQARAALSGTGGGPTPRRGRRTFTAAQRAEISRRMKATWAARRAAKAKSAGKKKS
jgi:hypothetical protein